MRDGAVVRDGRFALGFLIGQVVKKRCKRRLVEIIRRVGYGDESQLAVQLAASQVGGGLNTSQTLATKRDVSGAAGSVGKTYSA